MPLQPEQVLSWILGRLPSRRNALALLACIAVSVVLIIGQLHSNTYLPRVRVRSLRTDVHSLSSDPTGEFKARLVRLDEQLEAHFVRRGETYNGTVYPSPLTEAQLVKYESLRGDSVRHHRTTPDRRQGGRELNNSTRSSSLDVRAHEESRGRILITCNFFQVAPLLPDFLASVANLIHFLGPDRLVFSVLEGPSSDGTPDILQEIFLPMLLDMGVKNEDIHLRLNWPRKDWGWRNRIEMLAELRNEALEPLWKSPPPEGWEAIVFLNDVYTSAAHILELIHLHLAEDAGVTCAWDNFYEPGTWWRKPQQMFYDSWVARTHSSGDIFYPLNKHTSESNIFFSSPTEKERYKKGLPMQAMSCWNGIAVLSPLPFLSSSPHHTTSPSHSPHSPSPLDHPTSNAPSSSPHTPSPHSSSPHSSSLSPPPGGPVRFRMSPPTECSQSECFLLCRDFWRWGLGRVQIVPGVRVGYVREMADWLASERREIGVRRGKRGEVLDWGEVWERERVNWVASPPEKVKCYPWPDLPGLAHDPWKSPDARWVDSLTG